MVDDLVKNGEFIGGTLNPFSNLNLLNTFSEYLYWFRNCLVIGHLQIICIEFFSIALQKENSDMFTLPNLKNKSLKYKMI